MIKFLVIIFIIFTLGVFSIGDAQVVSPGFNPENWPGRMPQQEYAQLKPLTDSLLLAMREQDGRQIDLIKLKIIKVMGRYAGTPELKPEYGKPLDTATPNFAEVEKLWLKSFERMKGQHGWEVADPPKADIQRGHRLRVSLRHARAYLHSYQAGLEKKDEFLDYAKKGFDYIASTQASNGVFGYPYDPNTTNNLKRQAYLAAERGKQLGIKTVENGWIINDLGDGGLQFDNGVCGIGLIYAYAITGDKTYLKAAQGAAEWAMTSPLVLNFNYNCFSGWVLARLYRLTNEKKYLDAAKEKFIFGVLPGQMENGRWFDQHNARIQYHSVMMRSLIEFYLALKHANDDNAECVKNRIILGLDNLSEQIITYGASNVHELLSLDALCMGLMTFGHHENWEKAVNVNVNFLCNHFLPELEKRKMPMTETIAQYLLYRKFKEGKARSCEVELAKCIHENNNN